MDAAADLQVGCGRGRRRTGIRDPIPYAYQVVVAALVRAGAAVGGEVEAELDLEAAELDSSAAEVDLVAAEVDPAADPQLAESRRGAAGRGKALRWRRRWGHPAPKSAAGDCRGDIKAQGSGVGRTRCGICTA